MTARGLQICNGWRFSPETHMQSPSKPVGELGKRKNRLNGSVFTPCVLSLSLLSFVRCKFFECCPIKSKRAMLVGSQP
jgi:hypothetical protein